MTATGRHAAEDAAAPVSDDAAAPASDQVEIPGRCSVCPHPWADHDRLGTRYCSATMASAQSRGCICRPAAPARPARP